MLIDDEQKAFRERTADRMKSLEEQVSQLHSLREYLELAEEENKTLREYVNALRMRLRGAGLDLGLASDIGLDDNDERSPTNTASSEASKSTNKRRDSDRSISAATSE